MPTFTDKVIHIVRTIPKGQTMTYKQVAVIAGSIHASRAVGMIMSRNMDKSVPCHRVIRSDGQIGGYNGLQTGRTGPKSKLGLLKKEGVYAKNQIR